MRDSDINTRPYTPRVLTLEIDTHRMRCKRCVTKDLQHQPRWHAANGNFSDIERLSEVVSKSIP